MTINATKFKATCLAVIDRVSRTRESVVITKHGKVVARLVPEVDTTEKPWLALRATAVVWHGDPFAAVVSAADVKALK